jgi:hypothetical protein
MGLYKFQDLFLEVEPAELESRVGLAPLWSSLSFDQSPEVGQSLSACVSIRLHDRSADVIPPGMHLIFSGDGFSIFENGDEFFLTDGPSTFILQPTLGRGTAYLSPVFADKPLLLQRKFWSFGLLKLLRWRGFFSLHAAGLVTPEGRGVLVIGPPGSGKSTLVLGLVRTGWKYLTDDAVLLRSCSNGVAALGLRRDIFIDADEAPRYSNLSLGEEVADGAGRMRRPVNLEINCGQRVSECRPDLLLFTHIVPKEESSLTPLDQVKAMKHLLEASGPQLLDRHTMGTHLEVLRELLTQTKSFELGAGLDLYRNPETLRQLFVH